MQHDYQQELKRDGAQWLCPPERVVTLVKIRNSLLFSGRVYAKLATKQNRNKSDTTDHTRALARTHTHTHTRTHTHTHPTKRKHFPGVSMSCLVGRVA